ncbi:MAG: LCP family protein [Propionibacteriaceae bacterium]|nr:LCP family protein [Propionibacteriaceae bacterium]
MIASSDQANTKYVPARAVLNDDGPARREGGSKPRRGVDAPHHHRGLRITLISVLAVVLVIGCGLGYAWFDLNSRLHSQDISGLLSGSRPPADDGTGAVKYPGDPFAGRAVNILVMGTDSRDGSNSAISADDPGGARSDTTFIAHVSADRTRIDVVSIPRDTWITIPQCVTQKGKLISEAGWTHMGFNAAFSYGYSADSNEATGAACAIRAVEAMSNVRIDAYVVVDFMGFVNVVDAIGGVDVTLLCPIKSPNAGGLNLPAGPVHLDGMTAVDVARARTGTGLGDGSDLQRIDRQHALFNAIMDKAFQMNYVTDFPKLYNLVGAVISSVTTDLGTNLAEIAGFAYSLKNLSMSNVTFTTIPIASAGNGVNVVLVPSQDEPVWKALRTDQPIPGLQPEVTSQVPSDSVTPTDLATTPTPDDASPPAASSPTTPPGPPTIQQPSDCS